MHAMKIITPEEDESVAEFILGTPLLLSFCVSAECSPAACFCFAEITILKKCKHR